MSKNRFKRKRKSKFLMIEGYIMRSSAWQALSPNDKATYLELKWRYDGLNNGRIGLGCRDLAKALHSSKDTANRSLKKLEEIGFVVEAKPSGFNVKNRVATEWRLTEYRCDVSGHLPTKDFMKWQPQEKTQSHQKDAQSHHTDTESPKKGQNKSDSRTTGTVKPFSSRSQSHQKDTYNITMGGGVQIAPQSSMPVAPKWRGRSRQTQSLASLAISPALKSCAHCPSALVAKKLN